MVNSNKDFACFMNYREIIKLWGLLKGINIYCGKV